MSLDHARAYRRKRSRALDKVRYGAWPLRTVVRDVPDGLGTCPVWQVLMAAPGMGKETVRETLERANVYALLELGKLNVLQRKAILNELPRRVK